MHSVFGKINYGGLKKQQLKLGTGTAMWWVTEPHCLLILVFEKLLVDVTAFGIMAFDEMSPQCSVSWHFGILSIDV